MGNYSQYGTKIPNTVMDALCSHRIPGEERQVLDVIMRKTYGWGKHEDAISLSQFTEITGIKRPNVVRSLKSLSKKGIIAIGGWSSTTTAIANIYSINEVIETWSCMEKKPTVINSDTYKEDIIPPV